MGVDYLESRPVAWVRLVFRLLTREVILMIMLRMLLGLTLACRVRVVRSLAIRLSVASLRNLFPGSVPLWGACI